MFRKSNMRGFTLIELMIVVAIIAILAGIGFPMYQDYVRKVRRTDATTVLTEAAQFMERFYTANHRYHQDRTGTAVALPADLAKSPKDSSETLYTISINAAGDSNYTLVADPTGKQEGNGNLIITNTGAKGWDQNNDGSIGASENCWNKKCG